MPKLTEICLKDLLADAVNHRYDKEYNGCEKHCSRRPNRRAEFDMQPAIPSMQNVCGMECYMSKRVLGKNSWSLFLLLLAGIVLGGLIGNLAADAQGFGWLNYGQSFGFQNPIVLDLGILVITFALSMKVTIAGIIGVMIAVLVYRIL